MLTKNTGCALSRHKRGSRRASTRVLAASLCALPCIGLTVHAFGDTAAASPNAALPNAIELDVNVVTGDVQLNGNSAGAVTSINIASLLGGLLGNTTFTPFFNAVFPATAVNSSHQINAFNTFSSGSFISGLIDVGNVYNVNLGSQDLTFQFSEKSINRGGLQTGTVVYVSGSGSGAITPGVWDGGNGNWSDAAKWSTGVSPNDPALTVRIDNNNATASSVTLDQDAQVGLLAVDANDTLFINAGRTLTLAANATSPVAGVFNNRQCRHQPGRPAVVRRQRQLRLLYAL